ncbi:KRI1-like family C-terminal-domain-containing protein [Pelagophyceae sp. CCMP2097]|nr:KRI1-like family C-terminal-domain-containing protein [Pelagophyceae sp. CCMP2097]
MFDDGSDDDERGDAIKVNKQFASAYEQREQKRLLMKEAALGLNDDDSDSDASSEDEDANELTADMDVRIMKTINAIRRGDKTVYDKDTRFFDSAAASKPAAAAKEKSRNYKDVVRDEILQQAENSDDDDDGDDDAKEAPSGLSYNQEQDELKKAFSSISAGDEASDDGDEDMFAVREKQASQRGGDAQLALLKSEAASYAATARDSVADAFLADFVAKRRWAEPAEGVLSNMDGDDEHDDEGDDAADAFEAKYNFRFEQAGGDAITSHARGVKGSLRRVDDTRKKARAAIKDRKASERKNKEEELRRLKNLRRAQILEQCALVARESGGAKLAEDALESADWDPDKHDAHMAQAFGDDYYSQEADDKKAFVKDWDDDEDDDVLENEGEEGDDAEEGEEGDDAEEDDGEAAEAEAAEVAGAARKRAVKKTVDDEMNKLDYEDIVAGLPTRFKYKSVAANAYGLTTDELLNSSDADLKQLVSMKKLAPYREETHVPAARRHKWRSQLLAKQRLEAGESKKPAAAPEAAPEASDADAADATDADAAPDANEDAAPDGDAAPDAASKKRKRRRKTPAAAAASAPEAAAAPKAKKADKGEGESEKKKKKKKVENAAAMADGRRAGLDKARLASYGL